MEENNELKALLKKMYLDYLQLKVIVDTKISLKSNKEFQIFLFATENGMTLRQHLTALVFDNYMAQNKPDVIAKNISLEFESQSEAQKIYKLLESAQEVRKFFETEFYVSFQAICNGNNLSLVF